MIFNLKNYAFDTQWYLWTNIFILVLADLSTRDKKGICDNSNLIWYWGLKGNLVNLAHVALLMEGPMNLRRQSLYTHLWPFSKSKFNQKSERVNLVAPASPIYPLTVRYSTNWDRKSWPGSEIQMYNGCPCLYENVAKVQVYQIIYPRYSVG